MSLFSLAFLCGVLLLQQCSHLLSNYLEFIFLLLALIIRKPIVVAFMFGLVWALFFAHMQLSWELPKNLEGKVIIISGFVASIPEVANKQTNFLFKLDKVNNKTAHGLARLSWPMANLHLNVGDAWSFSVKLKRIHGTMNPGGFDMEAWSLQQGIRVSGYVVTTKAQPPKNLQLWNARYMVDRMRQYVGDQIAENLPRSHTSPWITALAIGERKNIDAASWKVLRNTGTNHLMAIAGLHIGFMSAFIYGLVLFIWRRVAVLTLYLPAQHAASLAALFIALIYSAMAGFSIPTQRACLMFSTFLLVVLLRRNVPVWHIWSMALMVVLLFNPLSVLVESFWLSFASVALIIYGMKGRLAPGGWWWKHARIQWVIAIGLIPLSIWLFKQCSIISFVTNSIAIPWVGFLIVPLTLLGCFALLCWPWLGSLCLKGADKLLELLWSILTYFSECSWSSWYHDVPHIWILGIACVGIVMLLVPSGFPGRYFGICWLMPLFFYQHHEPAKGEVWFTLLDVGQGLSAVIQTQHHLLVYDAGVKWGDYFDVGESIVLPFLRHQGIKKIDMLVISHGDNDHRGGANAILQQMPVLTVKTSVPYYFKNASYCLRGTTWLWDDVEFSFIYPTQEFLGLGNDSSCVLKITSQHQSILLTGDIEKMAEEYLINTNPAELRSTIIVAPHHGSKTSGMNDFIEAVYPKIVLFPTGYRNRYHFPHPSVVQEYRNIHATLLNTAEVGAISLNLPGTLVPTLYRDQHKRYWSAPGAFHSVNTPI